MISSSFETLSAIAPTAAEKVILALGGVAGAAFTFCFGGWSIPLIWLFVFIFIDYVTGIIAAIRTGACSSRRGFNGIAKKFVIVLVVAMCHGLDEVLELEGVLGNGAIVAYIFNELVSVIENIDRAGWGSAIPAPIRQALACVRERHESKLQKGGER